MRIARALMILLAVVAFGLQACPRARAQGALLLEDANGIAEVMGPTGHDALYFARICAAGPTKLRRCEPGEPGVVIARYHGIAGYDWLAMPLIPYLYSVEDASQVPSHVNREIVQSLRLQYHDAHLQILGDAPEGSETRRGWNQLLGAAYERRIWAFRFDTTEAQDDAFIAKMNADSNQSHFNILFRNCANFSSTVLNLYFPHSFMRHVAPDGGIVTPRQVAYELVRYAKKHPEIQLTVTEIPLVPGIHRTSRVGKSAAESFLVTGYVIPIAFFSPIAGGVIVADALAWGRYPLPLKNATVASPETVASLATSSTSTTSATGNRKTREGEDASDAESLSEMQQ
jgi:hypothetical protein